MENKNTKWTVCKECQGAGKVRRRVRKKNKLLYQAALKQFEKSAQKGTAPERPRGNLDPCVNCAGSGLMPSASPTPVDHENYPQVAIIGGGIGGAALAVACLHRGIPFTLFERDDNFNARSQGYGLTLQQASKAIEALGILKLEKGIISTKHLVHNTDGKVIAEWGMRKWLKINKNLAPKRTNVHIARQALRFELLEQLKESNNIKWGHQLTAIHQHVKNEVNDKTQLTFAVDGKQKSYSADLVVGADGIRSTVRKIIIGNDRTPLRYLNCIVILGICPLNALADINPSLLDSATVFQTANGNERIYVMPFDVDSVMWQLSFPMTEKAAKELSNKGAEALKKEAAKRTPWHDPIPQIIAATEPTQISGYPVYDRELLKLELLQKEKQITLIGDAAHPMSPFKGQGANQALLDALTLARMIAKECKPFSNWKNEGIRKRVLTPFEVEMLKRSAVKVKDSAKAADFLHSEIALQEVNKPRGSR